MYLPSGKIVKSGDSFTDEQAAGLNLRALERGFAIRHITRVSVTKKKKDK